MTKPNQIDVKTLGPLPPGIKQLTKEDLKFGEREKRLLKELIQRFEDSRETLKHIKWN